MSDSKVRQSGFTFVSLAALACLLLFSGCGGGSRGSGGYEAEGRLQREVSETPIPGTTVTIEEEGDEVKDTTDENGSFKLRVNNGGEATFRFNNAEDVDAPFALTDVPVPTRRVAMDLTFEATRTPQITARRLTFFDENGNVIEERVEESGEKISKEEPAGSSPGVSTGGSTPSGNGSSGAHSNGGTGSVNSNSGGDKDGKSSGSGGNGSGGDDSGGDGSGGDGSGGDGSGGDGSGGDGSGGDGSGGDGSGGDGSGGDGSGGDGSGGDGSGGDGSGGDGSGGDGSGGDGSGGDGSGGDGSGGDGSGGDGSGGDGSGGDGSLTSVQQLGFFSDLKEDRIFSFDQAKATYSEVIKKTLTPIDLVVDSSESDNTDGLIYLYIATKESTEIQRPALRDINNKTVVPTDSDSPQAIHLFSYMGNGPTLLYYAPDDASIKSIIRLDTENSHQTLISNVGTVTSMLTHLSNSIEGVLIWAEKEGKLRRATPTGEQVSDILVENVGTPAQIAFDPNRELIYWIDVEGQQIKRCTLSGQNVTTILDLTMDGAAPAVNPAGLVVDYDESIIVGGGGGESDDSANILYWSDRSTGKVFSYAIGSGQTQEVFTLPNGAAAIAGRMAFLRRDSEDWLFVASEGNGSIIKYRLRAAASDVYPVLALDMAKKIVVEPLQQRLYWISEGSDNLGGAIRSSRPDGSDIRTSLLAGSSQYPADMVVAMESNRIFYTDLLSARGAIKGVPVDGGAHEAPARSVYESSSVEFSGLTVHEPTRTLYWFGSDNTIRSGEYPRNTDPTDGNVIYSGNDVSGVSLTYEQVNDVLYWIDSDLVTIKAMNLRDQSTFTVEESDVDLVPGLTIDYENSRLIWATTAGTVRFASFGSSDAEDLFQIEESSNVQLGDLSLATTYSVSGHIYQSDGSTPFAGIAVSGLINGYFEKTVHTDENGLYHFEGVPGGVEITVTPGSVTDPEFTPGTRTLTITKSETGIDFVGLND